MAGPSVWQELKLGRCTGPCAVSGLITGALSGVSLVDSEQSRLMLVCYLTSTCWSTRAFSASPLTHLSTHYPHCCLALADCLGSSPTARLGCLPVSLGCWTQHFLLMVGNSPSGQMRGRMDGAWSRGPSRRVGSWPGPIMDFCFLVL